MSASVENYRDDVEATYAVDFSRDREPVQARSRFPEYRRRGGAPTRVGGMHCRRNKRWTWGSGRSARMVNTRAFAGAVAFAIASVASSVFGQVTIDTRTINNVGNAGNATNGLGAVPYVFQLGRFEVTNSQYAAFLNAVGRSNTNNIYNSAMNTDVNGGITQSGTSGSFTYAVKANMGNEPVNFVNWYSAARFANWLHNGQTTNVASMETGSYTLNNVASGPVLTRTANATWVLPNLNEWFKGGFHNATGLTSSSYTQYASNSNTMPTASVTSLTAANTANFNGATAGSTGPLAVGAYTNTTSAYGLYDMMGSVTEMTEAAQATSGTGLNRYATVSGAWSSLSTTFAANFSLAYTTPLYAGTAAANSATGFRLAKVEPVPEPGTIALAGVGLAGLGGIEWSRRRKAKARFAS
jgi:formylglycine-generating enzyme required for sulfatase activity